MAPIPGTPRRAASARSRQRPKSAGGGRSEKVNSSNISSEPPPKKRRYIPGGPGGGGRYVEEDGTEIPVGGTGPGGYNYVGPRGRIGRENLANGVTPIVYNRRDRSTRTTRTMAPRSQQPTMRFTSAAHAAAVVQSDGYKPREERAWEEFHPNLDIDAPMMALSSDAVDGIASRPVTPAGVPQSADGSTNGTNGLPTPNGIEGSKTKSEGIITPAASLNGEPLLTISIPGTPGGGKRRPGRPPKDPVAFFTARAAKLGKGLNIGTPKQPKIIPPVQNINAKEKLTLPQPSYRKTDTLARFDDKSLGLVRYVDKSMANVGYQESDIFIRPEGRLIKAFDANLEEDLDLGPGYKSDGESIIAIGSGGVGRVEYDMDEQDDKWLHDYNINHRAGDKNKNALPITREIFEITITKIEKEWHALEKRIPKPNPKPPQTHRPRSSSAAAVNGEPQAGEEQDSKCAICDDGDCENTNAIVFCDGCDLAVHQECYGVPFIPEGQWLCRKCQLIGRGVPTCIFCPNTDGAFKQTNASKWAHLLCAMWIPEVSLGNHTFMEPVMEVEKVPKTRWKLTCYLCKQRMGACIQCGNKACYQAFHVTCARRAHLFLKMKNTHGTLAVLDGTTVLKAFCDKHCPPDYTKENDVAMATREARIFYRKTMRGRLWADSQDSALAMAATHRHAVTEHQPDESQLTGEKVALTLGDSKKKGNQPQKPIWKLPSGAPVIPEVVLNSVITSLQRFPFNQVKLFAQDACKYWTLKREARRGAALLKRLQLQMETFSSMEITRRNFAGMGHAGRPRLARRITFAQTLVQELEKLKSLSAETVIREADKLEAVEVEEDFVNTVYFPIGKMFPPIVDKALVLDIKTVFTDGLSKLRTKLDNRLYTTTLPFAQDLSAVFSAGISTEPSEKPEAAKQEQKSSPSKKGPGDMKDRRRLAKRIIKAVQPQLEAAVRDECDAQRKPVEKQLKELERLLEAGLQSRRDSVSVSLGEPVGDADAEHEPDVEMTDASEVQKRDSYHTNGGNTSDSHQIADGDVEMQDIDAPNEEDDADVVTAVPSGPSEASGSVGGTVTNALAEVNGNISQSKPPHMNGVKNTSTPPDTNGYVSAPENQQPSPPTPPVSNGDNSIDHVDTLTSGGIPWYLRDFQPEGTSVLQESGSSSHNVSGMSDDVSDIDEGGLRGIGGDADDGDGEVLGAVGATPRTKKGKTKRRWKGFK